MRVNSLFLSLFIVTIEAFNPQLSQFSRVGRFDGGSRLYAARKGLSAGAVIAENKRARNGYEWETTYEAGIQLVGTEVKTCRQGNVILGDGSAEIINGELWLLNVHISEYNRCSIREQHPPKRNRKLLLKACEILKIEQYKQQRNMEVIPIKLYFSDKNFIKVTLGVGMQKTLYDKRQESSKEDAKRQIRRVMKGGWD